MQTSISFASRSTRSHIPSALINGSLLQGRSGVDLAPDAIPIPSDGDYDVIPTEVIRALPKMLRDGAMLLDTEHERGVFVTTALGVLSGCFPNVLGKHADGAMPLNLFVAVEAPAGSGKGSLRYARKLGQGVDRRLRAKSLTDQGDWFPMQVEKPSRTQDDARPPMRSLFLSGNSSERGLLEAVSNNMGKGVILESEAITLSKLFGGIGGNAIDLLLKAFHNEPVSVSRRGDQMHIPSPAFSVVVTGTPDTLKSIIAGVESGLLSRFSIYSFRAAPEWKSHRPNERTNDRDLYFDKAADRIDALYEMLEKRAVQGVSPLTIKLKDKHWDNIDKTFEAELKNLWASGMNPALEANVKRSAIVAFRITCILTILRAFDRKRKLNEVDELIATDADANAGVTLALLYLKHTLRVAARLPQGNLTPKEQRRMEFYSALPNGTFTTATAVEVSERLKPSISLRSVMRYLDIYVAEGLLQKEKHGVYTKSNLK